jgi:hypothetical protein
VIARTIPMNQEQLLELVKQLQEENRELRSAKDYFWFRLARIYYLFPWLRHIHLPSELLMGNGGAR